MLAELFLFLPFGDSAYRLNLLSAVLSAIAAGVTSLCVIGLWPHSAEDALADEPARWTARIGGAAGGLLLAFFPPVWKFAVVAEVFALNTLFTALLLLLLICWAQQPQRGGLLRLFGLTGGLATSNHHTIALLVPSFLLLLLHGYGKLGRAGRLEMRKSLIGSAALMGVGLLPYLYLPIAAATGSSYVWGDPLSLRGFWNLVSRAEYGSFQLGTFKLSGSPVAHLGLYLESINNGFTPVGLALAILGLWWLWRTQRLVALAFLLAWVITGPGFVRYARPSFEITMIRVVIERFYALSGVPRALAGGVGVCWVLTLLHQHLRSPWGMRLGFAGSMPAILGLVLSGPLLHGPEIDQSANTVVRDYGRDLLTPLEPNALLITRGDLVSMSVLYLTLVEKYRSDIIVLDEELMTRPAYVERQKRANPDVVIPFANFNSATRVTALTSLVTANLPNRAVYTRGSIDSPDFLASFDRVRAGFALRLLPSGSGVDESSILRDRSDLFSQMRFPTTMFPGWSFEYFVTHDEYPRLATT